MQKDRLIIKNLRLLRHHQITPMGLRTFRKNQMMSTVGDEGGIHEAPRCRLLKLSIFDGADVIQIDKNVRTAVSKHARRTYLSVASS